MSWLEAALTETASYPAPEALSTFETHIDPEWIEEALSATGTATLRRRRLPAEQVIWLVLGMALLRDRPMHEVVSRLDLALPGRGGESRVAASTVSQARQRLGARPMKWLFERCSERWAFESAREFQWHGLSVFALDGTTLRVADSGENRAHFGLFHNRFGASGYPLVRLVTLAAVSSHLIAAAAFGPHTESEKSFAHDLWEKVPDDAVVLVDRAFFDASLFLRLQRLPNRHWMIRAKTSNKWHVHLKLAPGDVLAEMQVSNSARSKDPTLPKSFFVRAVRYQLDPKQPEQWLLTSLLDHRRYSASDLVALYHQRWELELAYDEIKTHMLDRRETIRSRSPVGVAQELWGILLTYNLVRLEMQNIAREAQLPPSRIGFVAAMRFIRDEWAWCAVANPGTIPQKLARMRQDILAFVLPKRRTKRRYPRAVKIKGTKYPKKQRGHTVASILK
jgi:hypothetical protein